MKIKESPSKVKIQCVCGARLKASAVVCGTDVKCDVCGQIIHVPDLSETGTVINSVPPDLDMSAWLRHKCSCGKMVKAPASWAGKSGRCPVCKKPFTMPKSQSIQDLAKLDLAPTKDAQPQHAVIAESETEPDIAPLQMNMPPEVDSPAQNAASPALAVLKGVSKEEREAQVQKRLEQMRQHSAQGPAFRQTIRFLLGLPRTNPLASMIGASVLAIVAFVAFGIALAHANPDMVTRSSLPPVYFYDLSTGKTFVGSPSVAAPIDAPSGQKLSDGQPAGVRAYVTACGGCSDPSLTRVAYIESFTPEARVIWQKYLAQNSQYLIPIPDPQDPSIAALNAGRLVSKVSPVAWIPLGSPKGQAIVGEAFKPCPDGTMPRPCTP